MKISAPKKKEAFYQFKTSKKGTRNLFVDKKKVQND